MRIAVIGAGISGLSCAYWLDRRHDVQLFEAQSRIGGHSHTHDVTIDGETVAVDTGFIVYNERNYPDLIRFLAHLDVPTIESDMSFAASIDCGRFEYCGSNLASMFAQPSNLFRPSFVRMLVDIARFNRLGRTALDNGTAEGLSLGEFLDRHNFGANLRYAYVLPMGAAIWSTPLAAMMDYPAATFLRFFDNHGLLTVNDHPQWRTLTHRSRDYVQRVCKSLRRPVHAGDPVAEVTRDAGALTVQTASGRGERFDQVVMAAHADESLAALTAASPEQADFLSCFRFQENDAILHTDAALMPKRRRAWASWNYLSDGDGRRASHVSLTYWMNQLQSIQTSKPLLVTLNPSTPPEPETVLQRMRYSHPIFDDRAVQAQSRLASVQGQGGIWFAGAWLGYGFHEDGLRSGLDVAAALDAPCDWQADRRTPVGLPDEIRRAA